MLYNPFLMLSSAFGLRVSMSTISTKYEIRICTYAMDFAGFTVLLKNQSFKLILLINNFSDLVQ